ncbi:TPA: hypothetical protein ACGXNJ_002947 [Bacillus cereus]
MGKTKIELVEINGEMVEAKKCLSCGKVVPLEGYQRMAKGLGGRMARCKECVNVGSGRNSKVTLYDVEYNGEMTKGKYCTGCGELKALEEFSRSKEKTSGRVARCKACSNKGAKTYPVQRIIVDGHEVEAKECATCHEVLPLDKFNKGAWAGNRQNKCKPCTSEYQREYYKKKKANVINED